MINKINAKSYSISVLTVQVRVLSKTVLLYHKPKI